MSKIISVINRSNFNNSQSRQNTKKHGTVEIEVSIKALKYEYFLSF